MTGYALPTLRAPVLEILSVFFADDAPRFAVKLVPTTGAEPSEPESTTPKLMFDVAATPSVNALALAPPTFDTVPDLKFRVLMALVVPMLFPVILSTPLPSTTTVLVTLDPL